jgi:uncharacterized SAM-binding protein YcdF (DUF218 family)
MRRVSPQIRRVDASPSPTRCWGLVRRRELLVPTWRGWLLLAALALSLFAGLMLTIHPFLAASDGRPGGALVVEGWGNDQTIALAAREFQQHPYDKVYVTGGPLDWGAPLAEYKTSAERGASILLKLGLKPETVQAVPAPGVVLDRTYVSAMSLRRWFQEHGGLPANVHLVTEGAHARRSRLLFQKALGPEVTVTVTAAPALGYDPRRWWTTSSGVRVVLGEAIAYCYVRLFFHPPPPES